jgi:phosphoribosyl-ATP pyrophosphohydrolase / phosphoribosyl-AMP cyclohydrolase / histidinol dehydrogenase
MTPSWSVPYPSFTSTVAPVDATRGERAALPALGGRCRIHPATATHETYRSIVASAREQALLLVAADSLAASSSSEEASSSEEDKEQVALNKKLAKKMMKQGNALATKLLEVELQLDVSIVDVECVVDGADLMATNGCLSACLLDAGCSKIVTDGYHIEALDVGAQIPAHRLVAHFVYTHHPSDDSDGIETYEAQLQHAIQRASEFCTTVSIELRHSDDISESVLWRILQNCCSLEQKNATTDHSHHTSSHADGSQVQVVLVFDPKDCLGLLDADLATLVNDISRQSDNRARVALTNPTAEQLGTSFAKCCKTDRADGLYTTVVTTRNGEALGLVYSSVASIVASLQCGRGVYYSRSRHGLWRKGDTSGHYQTLHRIDVDCDGDALRFCVTQHGGDDDGIAAFCHLNTLTCWGPPKGLRHLEEALQDRLQNAPAGSYTKRLFDDETLLRDKLVEEAQELCEAQDSTHVAEELADVLYFAMVRAVQAGVSLDDAAAVLDKRAHKVTRRPGDSKAFRISAGQTILARQQQQQQEQQQQQDST